MMRILITAGPTWVKVDEVRILTNIFSGRTGIYLAEEFQKKGYGVTLVVNSPYIGKKAKNIKIAPFRYYASLKKTLTYELRQARYDAIIHSAAVSDYIIKAPWGGKIPSGKKSLTLRLSPAEKIIKAIRKLAKSALLIQFKLEIKAAGLLPRAYQSLKENKSDFVVACAYEDFKSKFKASVIDRDRKIIPVTSKKSLVEVIHRIVSQKQHRLSLLGLHKYKF